MAPDAKEMEGKTRSGAGGGALNSSTCKDGKGWDRGPSNWGCFVILGQKIPGLMGLEAACLQSSLTE